MASARVASIAPWLAKEGQRLVQVAVALVALFDHPRPEGALFGIRRGHRLDHRQRQFALAEIVANVLAGGAAVAAVIQQVVDDLERDAERIAIGVQRPHMRLGSAPAITPPTSVAAENSAAVLPRTT
jgi:hypothetical protein